MICIKTCKPAQIGSAIIRLMFCSALLLGTSAASHAASITGSMELGGAYTIAGGSDLSDATALDLVNLASTGFADGAIGTTLPIYTLGDINTTPFVFDLFASIPNLLDIGGWQLGIDSLSIAGPRNTSTLTMSGTGTLSGNGYDATIANWSFSAQDTGSTFSMTVTAVPVPAAVWLFGAGLIGLIGVARRQRV